MSKYRVAITGATGFVGCRLAERLVLEGGYEVVGVVRRFSGPGLARLARLPVRLERADLLDVDELSRAVEGCDVVVHCAYGASGDVAARRRATVDGTRVVLEAATAAGAARFIHLSSSVVHGSPLPDRTVDETAPLVRGETPYERAKFEAENEVWRHHRETGLPVVVFRPANIYGPYGRRWTGKIVEEILAGATLIDGGAGIASFVYIDNLIDAILLSVRGTAGDGQAFLMIDDEALTWRDVYEGYARLLGTHPPLRTASQREVAALRRRLEPGPLRASVLLPLSMLPRVVRAGVSAPAVRRQLKRVPWLRTLKALLPDSVARGLTGDETEPAASGGNGQATSGKRAGPQLPDKSMMRVLVGRTRYSSRKVREVLGYRQRTSFEEALRRTGDWLRYQRVIS